MKRFLALLLFILCVLPITDTTEAARVRVVRRGPHRRTTVTVRRGFPLHRALPNVYVRAPRVAFRVTPRVFLPGVVFGAAVVAAAPAPEARVWQDDEDLDPDDGWTEFTMN